MMGLAWYILGVLTIFSMYVLYEYAKQRHLHWMTITGLGLGVFSILFSIAWAAGSVLEGVPRAASMGLLLFGLGGVVILIATLKFITVRHKSS
jgi:hypothetical protein